jgi:hypothetical protein
MTDDVSIGQWAEGLGLAVATPDPQDAGSAVTLTTKEGTRIEITGSASAARTIVCRRLMPAANIEAEWSIPQRSPNSYGALSTSATDVLAEVLRKTALAFPLVQTSVNADGDTVELEFTAPIFDDGLTRHSFVLTLSGLLRTVEMFDLVCSARAEQRAALELLSRSLTPSDLDAAITARAARPDLAPNGDPTAAPPTAPLPATAPAPAWAPTHDVKHRAQAWERPDPGAPVAGTIEARVPVQLLERQGAWAHVRCANGWSAWVDSRELEAR